MGYTPGLRQHARTIRFRLEATPPDDPGDLQQLDDLLQRSTGLPPTGRAVAPISRLVMAERVLALAAHLLKAARVPVFEAGSVINLTVEASGAATVVACVPGVDVLPPDKLKNAYKLSLNIMQLMQRALVTPAAGPDPEQAQKQIFERFVEPARAVTLEGGKSSQWLLNAAFEADVPFMHLGSSRYCLGWGKRALRMHRSNLSTDSHLGARAAQSKSMTAQFLREAGIPVPVHQCAGSRQQAAEVARAIGWPVVVKPDDRDRGEGVTTDIQDEATLYEAFDTATAFSRRILIEAQAPGMCHRVVVVLGRVLYSVKRLPKGVYGDGALTVEELAAQREAEESKKPVWERLKPWPVDALAQTELGKQGLAPSSVPEQGRWVCLRPRESAEWGGDSEDVTERLHPENASICIRAARQLGLDIAGVDLMTTDAAVPWHLNGAVINEVNSAPLLGESTVSRDKLPELFRWMFPYGSRIPVHAILGGRSAWERAEKIRAEGAMSGEPCYVTDHQRTLLPDGTELFLTARGLYARCTALLLDPEVDHIVLVVSTDELLRTGSPVDRFTSVEDLSSKELGVAIPDPTVARRLLDLLEPMLEVAPR